MKRMTAAVLAAALVALGGCSERAEPSPAPSQSGSIVVDAPADTPAATPVESPGPAAPSSIVADLGNNITVAAQVTQPDAGTPFGVYQTENFVFDRETACGVLLGEGWKVNDAIPPAEGIEYLINGEKELYLYDGGVGGLSMVTGERPSVVHLCGLAPTGPEEPGFMTGTEAVKLARDTLRALGLETQLVQCTPLTQESIDALCQVFKDEYGGDPAEYAHCRPCYVIELCQVAAGVPICNQDIELTTGDVDTPASFAVNPSIQVVVTEEGIHEVSTSHCLKVGAQVQAGLKVLSADEALAAFAKSYEDIINTQPIVIQSVRLQYAARPLSLTDWTRQLHPVWVLEGEENLRFESARKTEKDDDMVRPLTLFFDAVTGRQVEDSYR